MKKIAVSIAISCGILAPAVIGLLITAQIMISTFRKFGYAGVQEHGNEFYAIFWEALNSTWIGLGLSAVFFAVLMGWRWRKPKALRHST